MDIETIQQYTLSLPNVEECMPFGPENLVFKVNNKMFLLLSLDAEPLSFNAKCDPEMALELRESYPDAVLPGYHMNKKHWNTVVINGQLSGKQLKEMITNSYNLVLSKKK
jgi:predicted DNA-binding protein (MmcQ/YjbR family)